MQSPKVAQVFAASEGFLPVPESLSLPGPGARLNPFVQILEAQLQALMAGLGKDS